VGNAEPPGEGESSAEGLECRETDVAERSPAKPEAGEGCSLSLGERVRVRASAN
jgi:hypothetical protein